MVQNFTFVIFADPLNPLHGPQVKNLWSKPLFKREISEQISNRPIREGRTCLDNESTLKKEKKDGKVGQFRSFLFDTCMGWMFERVKIDYWHFIFRGFWISFSSIPLVKYIIFESYQSIDYKDILIKHLYMSLVCLHPIGKVYTRVCQHKQGKSYRMYNQPR